MACSSRVRGALFLSLSVLWACSSDGAPSQQPTDERWTIGIYMAADNNLDRAATNDINEILRAGVPENVSALILVDIQYDFMPGGALAVPEGDRIVPLAARLQGRFDLVVVPRHDRLSGENVVVTRGDGVERRPLRWGRRRRLVAAPHPRDDHAPDGTDQRQQDQPADHRQAQDEAVPAGADGGGPTD